MKKTILLGLILLILLAAGCSGRKNAGESTSVAQDSASTEAEVTDREEPGSTETAEAAASADPGASESAPPTEPGASEGAAASEPAGSGDASADGSSLPAESASVPSDSTSPANRDYILSASDRALYNPNQIAGLSDEELRIARNEIYARRGYIFSSEDMAEYFSKRSWYVPSVPAADFDEKVFNYFEETNLGYIQHEENLRAGKTGGQETSGQENNASGPSQSVSGETLEKEISDFLNSSPANGFLRSRFTEPGPDVDLFEVIYQINHIGVDWDTFRRELEKTGYELMTDVSYITADKLDEFLTEYTGYGLYEKEWNLNGVDYLSSIDTYFIEHGDTNRRSVELQGSVQRIEGSVYQVWCANGKSISSLQKVTLRRTGEGSYQFVSVD